MRQFIYLNVEAKCAEDLICFMCIKWILGDIDISIILMKLNNNCIYHILT